MTLYRIYRPQSFADFVNQKPIVAIIQNQILEQAVAHAYLFTGPRGVGKTTMARLIAKALNCENRKISSFEPCNLCGSCTEIIQGNSLDLIELDAASNRGIDEMRNLKENVRFAPAKSMHKVYIIDEAHMLTIPAFNALLKTLEEPPTQTIFILATTEPHKLPDTIISRCQRFDFRKVGYDEVEAWLAEICVREGVHIIQEILKTITLRSEGCLRDALSMLGQVITLGKHSKAETIDWDTAQMVIAKPHTQMIDALMNALSDQNIAQAFKIVGNVVEEGIDTEQFMVECIEHIRERLVKAVMRKEDEHRLYVMLDNFLKRYEHIENASFLPHLPLELALLDCIENSGNTDIATSHRQQEKIMGSKMKTDEKTINSGMAEDPVPSNAIMQQPSTSVSVNLSAIKKHWQTIVHKVKNHNNALPLILSACTPVRLEGNCLVLGFKYKLHQQVVKDQKNRSYIEQVLYDLFKETVFIQAELLRAHAELHPDIGASEATLQTIQEVFKNEVNDI